MNKVSSLDAVNISFFNIFSFPNTFCHRSTADSINASLALPRSREPASNEICVNGTEADQVYALAISTAKLRTMPSNEPV